jgi:GNAT superfamily N-acetyltransferase
MNRTGYTTIERVIIHEPFSPKSYANGALNRGLCNHPGSPLASYLKRPKTITRIAIVYRTNSKKVDWLGVAILVNHGDQLAKVQVYVRPDERRKGYGTALVKAIISRVGRNRRLVCDTSTPEATALFGKFPQFKVSEVAS